MFTVSLYTSSTYAYVSYVYACYIRLCYERHNAWQDCFVVSTTYILSLFFYSLRNIFTHREPLMYKIVHTKHIG